MGTAQAPKTPTGKAHPGQVCSHRGTGRLFIVTDVLANPLFHTEDVHISSLMGWFPFVVPEPRFSLEYMIHDVSKAELLGSEEQKDSPFYTFVLNALAFASWFVVTELLSRYLGHLFVSAAFAVVVTAWVAEGRE